MTGGPGELDRRTVLRGIGVLGLLAAVPGCSASYRDTRLTLGTGGTTGVYFALGTALAQAWQEELGLDARPEVRTTAGSVENLQLLASGAADVVFSQVDTAADLMARSAPEGPNALRALARIYDDVVHVVVPASSTITTLAGLRGARVSIGSPGSGYLGIAQRLLQVAGLAPETDLQAVQLGLDASVAALESGTVDAFFWSGGLPTRGVAELARTLPIRLLDLQDVIGAARAAYPVYAPGTVPAGSYGIPEPVTSLLVRNFLLVSAAMADDLASALVATMFAAQEQLAQASPAALTIDPRSAISTQPVPLHPGAQRFYQAAKNS